MHSPQCWQWKRGTFTRSSKKSSSRENLLSTEESGGVWTTGECVDKSTLSLSSVILDYCAVLCFVHASREQEPRTCHLGHPEPFGKFRVISQSDTHTTTSSCRALRQAQGKLRRGVKAKSRSSGSAFCSALWNPAHEWNPGPGDPAFGAGSKSGTILTWLRLLRPLRLVPKESVGTRSGSSQ